MLTVQELRMLSDLGKSHPFAEGVFVDLGCHVGGSTHAFCIGLNQAARKSQVHCFDIFVTQSETGYPHLTPGKKGGESFRDLFERQLAGFREIVTVHEGDLLTKDWPEDKVIDVLFVDAAKSWDLNNHINEQFLPRLVEGSGLLIQQDYVHEWTPWIPITVEILRNYFGEVKVVGGVSGLFRLKKKIPEAVVPKNLRSVPGHKLLSLFSLAVNRIQDSEARAIL